MNLRFRDSTSLSKSIVAKLFKAKREPHGFEFFFPIGSVHGRDSGGNMPFIIDIFKMNPSFWDERIFSFRTASIARTMVRLL